MFTYLTVLAATLKPALALRGVRKMAKNIKLIKLAFTLSTE